MEDSLAAFRTRLKKEAALQQTQDLPEKSSDTYSGQKEREIASDRLARETKNQRRNQPSSSVSPIVITDEPLVDENCCRWTGWDVTILATKFLLWSLMMALAVHVEFGAVFFVFTVFYVIFTNFRTSPRKRGELSAYSVFNPNFETIHGTVTAEQFERQMLYGAL